MAKASDSDSTSLLRLAIAPAEASTATRAVFEFIDQPIAANNLDRFVLVRDHQLALNRD